MATANQARSFSDPKDSRSSHDEPGSDPGSGSINNGKQTGSPTGTDDGEKAESSEHADEEAPAIPLSPMHEVVFIFVICMAQFLSLAGLSQSIAPLGIIGR